MAHYLVFQEIEGPDPGVGIEISGHRIRRNPLRPQDKRLTSSLNDITKFGVHRRSRDVTPRHDDVTSIIDKYRRRRHDLSRLEAPRSNRETGEIEGTAKIGTGGWTLGIGQKDSRGGTVEGPVGGTGRVDKSCQVNPKAVRSLSPIQFKNGRRLDVTESPEVRNADRILAPQRDGDSVDTTRDIQGKVSMSMDLNVKRDSNIIDGLRNKDGGVAGDMEMRRLFAELRSKNPKSKSDDQSASVKTNINNASVTFNAKNNNISNSKHYHNGNDNGNEPKGASEHSPKISLEPAFNRRRFPLLESLKPLPNSISDKISRICETSKNTGTKNRLQSLGYPFKINTPVLDVEKNIMLDKNGGKGVEQKVKKHQMFGEFGHSSFGLQQRNTHILSQSHKHDSDTDIVDHSIASPTRPPYTHRPEVNRYQVSHPSDSVFGKILQRRQRNGQEVPLFLLEREYQAALVSHNLNSEVLWNINSYPNTHSNPDPNLDFDGGRRRYVKNDRNDCIVSNNGHHVLSVDSNSKLSSQISKDDNIVNNYRDSDSRKSTKKATCDSKNENQNVPFSVPNGSSTGRGTNHAVNIDVDETINKFKEIGNNHSNTVKDIKDNNNNNNNNKNNNINNNDSSNDNNNNKNQDNRTITTVSMRIGVEVCRQVQKRQSENPALVPFNNHAHSAISKDISDEVKDTSGADAIEHDHIDNSNSGLSCNGSKHRNTQIKTSYPGDWNIRESYANGRDNDEGKTGIINGSGKQIQKIASYALKQTESDYHEDNANQNKESHPPKSSSINLFHQKVDDKKQNPSNDVISDPPLRTRSSEKDINTTSGNHNSINKLSNTQEAITGHSFPLKNPDSGERKCPNNVSNQFTPSVSIANASDKCDVPLTLKTTSFSSTGNDSSTTISTSSRLNRPFSTDNEADTTQHSVVSSRVTTILRPGSTRKVSDISTESLPDENTGGEQNNNTSKRTTVSNREDSERKNDWIVVRDYKTTHLGDYGGKYNLWTKGQGPATVAGQGHLIDESHSLNTKTNINTNAPNATINELTANYSNSNIITNNSNTTNNNNNNNNNNNSNSSNSNHRFGPQFTSESQVASRLSWKLSDLASRRNQRYSNSNQRYHQHQQHHHHHQQQEQQHRNKDALVPWEIRFPNRPPSRDSSSPMYLDATRAGGVRTSRASEFRPSSRGITHQKRPYIHPTKTMASYRGRSADRRIRIDSESPSPTRIVDIVRQFRPVSRESDSSYRYGNVVLGSLSPSNVVDRKYNNAAVTRREAREFIESVNRLQANQTSSDSKYSNLKPENCPDPQAQELLDYFWSYQGIGRQILRAKSGASSPRQGTKLTDNKKERVTDEKDQWSPPKVSVVSERGEGGELKQEESGTLCGGGGGGGGGVDGVGIDTRRTLGEVREKRKVHLVVKLPGAEMSSDE